MKVLSVVGTLAMFLVGGGIVIHGIPWLHHTVEQLSGHSSGLLASLTGSIAAPLVIGAVIGSIVLCLVKLFGKITGKQV